MKERLWAKITSLKLAPEMLLAGIALVVMIPSLGIGPISDDFSWLQQAKLGQSQNILEHLSQPAPFGYFRPLPMLFFKIDWMLFGPALWLYRLTALLLHVLTAVLIYRLARLFSYSLQISFLSSLIFVMMPCHAEALFWLCSVNELFSAFLVLSGLYLLLRFEGWVPAVLSSVSFLLALLSRESAFCFIPILIWLKYNSPKIKWRTLAVVIASASIVYGGLRLAWFQGLPPSYTAPSPGQLDINVLRLSSRLAQYFFKMLLPVKSLMEFFAFRPYVWFREIYSSPQMHPMAFWTTSLGAMLAILFAFYGVLKTSGRQIVWPLLFSVLALSIYLPFYNTGERFLYLPSAGVAVGLALWITKIIDNKRKVGLSLLVLTLMIYGVSFGNRLYRWHKVANISQQALARLNQRTEMLAPGPPVYLINMPGLIYGIPCFSYYTFNHAWDYTFPGRKVDFYFDPAPRPWKIDAAFSFSLKGPDFKPLP